MLLRVRADLVHSNAAVATEVAAEEAEKVAAEGAMKAAVAEDVMAEEAVAITVVEDKKL
jgi:hypothetical protein